MFPYNPDNSALVEAALGKKKADLVIRNGVLADVYTGCLTPDRSVAVSGGWISYVGTDAGYAIGKDTKIIEADGRIISPGFIDGHTHIANFYDISDFLEYSIPGGTTIIITEVDSYGFALGAEGFKIFLEQIKNRPIKIFCTVPPMVSASPACASISIKPDEIRDLLKFENVLGMGEAYWQNMILTPDERVLELMRETIKAGKSVQGHSAGAVDKRLAAYAAAGAISCHESVSPEDILNRLEMGYWTILRQGNIREDLASLKPLIGKIDLRRCMLCTDGTDPDSLLSKGYFNDVIQAAIDMGVEPVEAIRMASLNPAEMFHIDHLTGGIAPGRCADINILPGPRNVKPDIVISNGKIVFENGKLNVDLPRIPYPDRILKTVNIPFTGLEDYSVPVLACSSPGKVRTMDIQANGLLVREGSAVISSDAGILLTDPDNDLLKVVYIERTSGKGGMFAGFIRGWGMKAGAVATTLCWDASGIVAVGNSDIDLSLAVNKVIEHQGGTALALDGAVIIDIPFSIGGYVSEMRVEDLKRDLDTFQYKVTELGSTLRSALLTLVVLTSPAIPFMRITEKGYFRFRENDYVGL